MISEVCIDALFAQLLHYNKTQRTIIACPAALANSATNSRHLHKITLIYQIRLAKLEHYCKSHNLVE